MQPAGRAGFPPLQSPQVEPPWSAARVLPEKTHVSAKSTYVTALAQTNVNTQTAQILAGHSDPKVHQRYVAETTERAMLVLPEGVLPRSVAKPRGGQKKSRAISVPRVRIELTTRGFSVRCSTN